MEDKPSKETVQRETVWRQGGNAIKVQMESLMPDLSKITKAERIEEVVLIHCGHLASKPFQGQTHIFRQDLLLRDKRVLLLTLKMSFDT
jgi:hypothetical protein